MTDQEFDVATATVSDFFALLVGDADAAAARKSFCEVTAEAMKNVAGWLAIDSLLCAGDAPDTAAEDQPAPDPSRARSFDAVALVAQIAGELMTGTRTLLESGNDYAASALVRQLIECEYLFRRFGRDFVSAEQWIVAQTADEKWAFRPKKLRKVGGFDDKEYENHCSAGGHPTPAARTLLAVPRLLDKIAAKAEGRTHILDQTEALWLDYAFHCDRAWRAVADLLSAEHARFSRVRSEAVQNVEDARVAWHEADAALVECAGVLLAVLKADPQMPLCDLIATRR